MVFIFSRYWSKSIIRRRYVPWCWPIIVKMFSKWVIWRLKFTKWYGLLVFYRQNGIISTNIGDFEDGNPAGCTESQPVTVVLIRNLYDFMKNMAFSLGFQSHVVGYFYLTQQFVGDKEFFKWEFNRNANQELGNNFIASSYSQSTFKSCWILKYL